MSKHTPGPWDLVTRLREGRSNDSNLQWTVTSVHIEAADEIDRLRAVNADLLEALKMLRSQYVLFVGPDDDIATAVLSEVDSAIAKAEGKDDAAR